MQASFTSESLAALAGLVLSLAFSYIPGLSAAWEKLTALHKRLAMLGLLLITAGAVYGLSCGGVLDAVACTREGLLEFVGIFIAALVANQSAYMLSPRGERLDEEFVD